MPGHKDPPKEHRFSSENQPANRGRKKGSKGIKSIIKKYINQEIEKKNYITKKDEKLPVIDHIIITAIAKALSGDDKSREDILNRYYGRATEKMEMSGTMNVNNITEILKEWRKKPEKDSAD